MATIFESAVDKKLRSDLDKMFGNSEAAKDIKQAIFLSRKGLITDETIAEYCRVKEAERQAYLEVMDEVNPDYAFKVGDVLLSEYNKSDDVVSESTECNSTTAECGNSEYGGDENALPVNKE